MAISLEGRVALVTGATRGAGRAIAITLAEAGAFVYCTGRSLGVSATKGRPETLDETVARIHARGGCARALSVDHTVPAQVEALAARIREEHGALDVLVNDIWGGDALCEWGKPFWELDPAQGKLMWERGLWSHVLTSRHLVPAMVQRKRGLIVEVGDGHDLSYRGNLHFDLVKTSVLRIAYAMAEELRPFGITALSVTPGFLRSEAMLDHFGVREESWRDAIAKDPHYAQSETPFYVARGIAALAADPNVHAWSGRATTSAELAARYGFDDVDGRHPDWPSYYRATFPEKLDFTYP